MSYPLIFTSVTTACHVCSKKCIIKPPIMYSYLGCVFIFLWCTCVCIYTLYFFFLAKQYSQLVALIVCVLKNWSYKGLNVNNVSSSIASFSVEHLCLCLCSGDYFPFLFTSLSAVLLTPMKCYRLCIVFFGLTLYFT